MILGAGPEPDRAGHRVRLLLCARRDDGARVGPRRGDDQLQPGDGLDRLRHLRPPLLRAAHGRGRARGGRGRAARGRDRPVRRPDAAAAGEGARGGWGPAAGHPGRRDRPRRGPRPLRGPAAAARDRAPALRHGAVRRGGAGDRRGRGLPAPGPSVLRAGWPGDGDLLLASTTSSAYLEANVKADQEHPLLLDRFLEDAIEVDVDALADGTDVAVAGIMQHVEEAGRPLRRLGLRDPADEPGLRDARGDHPDDPADRARAGRRRA